MSDEQGSIGKVVTGKVLKSKLKQAERQIEAKGWTVLGVGADPDSRYWRITWLEREAAQSGKGE